MYTYSRVCFANRIIIISYELARMAFLCARSGVRPWPPFQRPHWKVGTEGMLKSEGVREDTKYSIQDICK